ncbi:MAG: DUF928 domain-containing protein [Cyanobacteria bacterium J06635_10]
MKNALIVSTIFFAVNFNLINLAALPADVSGLKQQNAPNRPTIGQRIARIFGQPGRNKIADTTGRGSGSREGCPATDEELIAIVPVSDDSSYSTFLEQTISSMPTLYFYVPFPPGLGLTAELNVDLDEETVHQNQIDLEQGPGLIPVKITTPLEDDQEYRWTFTVICSLDNASQNPYVDGWLKKQSEDSLPVTIDNTLQDEQRLQIFIENLLWFDMLQQIIELQSDPNSGIYSEAWLETLCLTALSPETVTEIVGYKAECVAISSSENL